MWRAAALVVLLAGVPVVGTAQETGRAYRIGFVGPYSAGLDWSMLHGFQARLRELGWIEGRNLSTTYRWAEGDFTRFPALTRSVMAESPDLLVLPCGPAVKAAREVSPTIPLVARCIDLVGLDEEAAKSGFTTGVTYLSPGATRRRLELLKELVPRLSRVGVLHERGSSWTRYGPEVEAAGRAVGLHLERIEWVPTDGPAAAFLPARQRGVEALLTLGGGALHADRHALFSRAAADRLPVMYDFPMNPAADDVGLIAYYADVGALFRTVAEQADQVLD
ncbi:MAG TPA: ABC transporter substrate binding protein [Methylomirabilota bacterium]|nr:ABC transporter substrate binding protein [Methylomirabilota bacterium]